MMAETKPGHDSGFKLLFDCDWVIQPPRDGSDVLKEKKKKKKEDRICSPSPEGYCEVQIS